jgi:membrane-associated phospholipid phosphatase
VAFSLAAAISEEAREPWVTVLTYGTASAVGWSRVYDDRHWTSDVVAGALVGALVGRETVRWLHARRAAGAGPTLAVTPDGLAVVVPAF